MTLSDNIHQLIRPHLTQRPGGGYTTQHAYLDQLAEAVKPGTRTAGTSQGGQPLPINAAAVDLWKRLDTEARELELERRGRARGALGSIIEAWEGETNHDWQDALEHATQGMLNRIVDLLDPPPRRRPLGAECYDCGREWAYTIDGERTPAVTIGTHHDTGELRDLPDMDMTCAVCEKTWIGNEMRWPLKVVTQDRQPA